MNFTSDCFIFCQQQFLPHQYEVVFQMSMRVKCDRVKNVMFMFVEIKCINDIQLIKFETMYLNVLCYFGKKCTLIDT